MAKYPNKKKAPGDDGDGNGNGNGKAFLPSEEEGVERQTYFDDAARIVQIGIGISTVLWNFFVFYRYSCLK